MGKAKRNRKKKSSKVAVPTAVDPQSHLEKLESLIEEAESAIDTFSYEQAESKLLEILQIDSSNCKYLEMLAGVYMETFQFEKAQDILKRCIEISPEIGYSKYFSIGQMHEGLDAVRYFEKGIQILEKELENSENIEPTKEQNKRSLIRNLSDAYCSVSELFMTDCCFEENAEEKCSKAIDSAIKSDPCNPEAYQCLANYQLVKEKMEEAKESLQKSISLWLPQLEDGLEESNEEESEIAIPVYESRIKTSKLLIELEMFYDASKVLHGLLDEDDEVVEVWYLLGWLNHLRGGGGEDGEYKKNAHHYLTRAKEVNIKLGMEEDECMHHINELLKELESTLPESDEEEDAKDDEENISESNLETDSEEEMET